MKTNNIPSFQKLRSLLIQIIARCIPVMWYPIYDDSMHSVIRNIDSVHY